MIASVAGASAPGNIQPAQQNTGSPTATSRAAVRLSGLAAGTQLLTPHGYRAVESLRRGDLVAALIGRGPLFVPIVWIGRRTVSLRRGSMDQIGFPVRIRSGAVADGMPGRDLLTAPDHAIYIQGTLYLARQLVNSASILFESRARSADYWGIQLERHDILIAENLPVESLLPASAAAFTEITAPPLQLVGHAAKSEAASASLAQEFAPSILMSARWFRRRLLNRQQAFRGPPVPVVELPDGLLDVGVEARAVLENFATLAAQRGVHLQLAIEAGLTVRAAHDRLHELLGAMLTHAIHGMPGGRVLLGAMRHAGRIQIAIIDGAVDVDRATQEAELQHAMQLAALQGATLEVDVRAGEGTTLLLRLLAP